MQAQSPTTETKLWHPFAAMGTVKDHELTIVRGEDVWLWDDHGARYLDATASLWYANVGHARPEIAQAIARQLSQLEAYTTFGDLTTEPARELAQQLSERAPMQDARVFLASGGGDAVEAAAKIARRYWSLRGCPERVHLISRTNAYHGTHGYGTALGGIEANREGWGPDPDRFSRVPYDSLQALREEIHCLGADHVAAVLVEPVIGAGGVLPPPDGYIEGLDKVCSETGVLLIVDAVICGFGRLGTWFGIERWGVEPDMICFAKGVTSGYLPLGGVIVSRPVSEPFWADEAPPLRHGVTYAGHATCCAAALANIALLERDELLQRGRTMESQLEGALAPLAQHSLVAEVRAGTGLMAAVELAPDLLQARPGAVGEAAAAARRRGVIVRALGTSLAVSPPLTATGEHLQLIAEAISACLEDIQTANALPA
jgi:adenosylmethionine-8-amino-7-oxononanoate aminotransferase